MKTKKDTKKKLIDWKWITIISLIAFALSMLFSFIGETIIPNAYVAISMIILLLFILLGIVFDIIGVAVTVADISTFNSMAAKRVKGSELAVKFIKNANKVSSFCCDVIGDVCGVVSGSTGLSIALQIHNHSQIDLLILVVVITAIVSTLTIGGKAIGKSIAIDRCNSILHGFVRILSIVYKG
jgi:CBS domain containing-hemolysin-like protein